ncbi:MAG: aminopeptidase, partial [Frondihabitans sp.]|nr:aminopeptidase [Frondihabitans sp.]
QEAPADYPTIRPHRLAIGLYDLTGAGPIDSDSLVRTHRVEIDVDGERTEVPELVGLAKSALILINDDDLAYAKVRLDERSLASAIKHLSKIKNPLARAIVWGSVWDATRDAETAASNYVRLVLDNIATETESTTIRTTLTQLTQVARSYVDPAKREATIVEVGNGLWALARGAEAGSDAQFQFVKFFANIASTDQHGQALQGLVDGTITLPGLEIDTDLRWELLEGLVLVGLAGDAEIDAALASDNTANGAQAAARARATIPTVEGKLAAFASIVDSDEQPNAIVRATAVGFQHTNDPSILEPVIERYFSSLGTIWASRSYHIADTLVSGLYPAGLANAALVAAANEWLAANPETPALRRIVTENVAGTERALRVQAADA